MLGVVLFTQHSEPSQIRVFPAARTEEKPFWQR